MEHRDAGHPTGGAEPGPSGTVESQGFDLNAMPVIERRRIEAMVLGPMLRAFQNEIGVERTNAIARQVITGIAREQGSAFARRTGKRDLKSFAANKEPWRRGGALEVQTLEETPKSYSFNVTRCRYAEMYRELGFADLGDIFPCTRDFEFSKGYNPDVKLVRTQTIMKGAAFCDFRYRTAEGPGKDAG